MKFKHLGNTDLQVSQICLGTMTWGEQNTENEAFEQMDYSMEQGVNFFDTAEYYSVKGKEDTYGSTEKIIGNWFKQKNNREKEQKREEETTATTKSRHTPEIERQINNYNSISKCDDRS